MLALQIGSLVNENNISSAINTSYVTLKKYLFILQNTFIVKLISPYYTNRQKEIVKMPKSYFFDMGLRNSVIKSFVDIDLRPDIGFLIENYLFCMLNSLLKSNEGIKFWRTKNGNEVDFVIETNSIIPIESKYQRIKSPSITLGMRVFLEKYNPKTAVVVTRDYQYLAKKDKTIIYFIPAWLLG